MLPARDDLHKVLVSVEDQGLAVGRQRELAHLIAEPLRFTHLFRQSHGGRLWLHVHTRGVRVVRLLVEDVLRRHFAHRRRRVGRLDISLHAAADGTCVGHIGPHPAVDQNPPPFADDPRRLQIQSGRVGLLLHCHQHLLRLKGQRVPILVPTDHRCS